MTRIAVVLDVEWYNRQTVTCSVDALLSVIGMYIFICLFLNKFVLVAVSIQGMNLSVFINIGRHGRWLFVNFEMSSSL